MDFKGSLRGIKKLMGVNSPKHHDSTDGPNTIPGRIPPSILAFPPTPDCRSSQDTGFDSPLASPSPKEKRANRFTASMRNRMMGRKAGKSDSYYDRQDSPHKDECLEDEVPRSSPIPILNPLDIKLPMTRGRLESKSLENLIAPGGYPPSLPDYAEKDRLGHSCHNVEKNERPPPLAAHPRIQQVTNSPMDNAFEDDCPVLIGMHPSNPEDIVKPVSRPGSLAPFKRPSTGHVNHATSDWHSNDPVGAAVIAGSSTSTPSEELRHLRGVARSVSRTLAALSGDSQATNSIEPIQCPATRKWLNLSLKEAISVTHDVRLYEGYIDKYGVDAFAEAIKNGLLMSSDHPDFLVKHFCSTTSRISMASTASSFGYPLERCDSIDSDIEGSKWISRLKVDLSDSEVSCKDSELNLMSFILDDETDSLDAVVDGYAKAREDMSLGESAF
jgi:hypothetical protein